MFLYFFYALKNNGIPVSPTSFLRLHRALQSGLIASIDDLYTGARTILVKNEKYFDRYDQIFAAHFNGTAIMEPQESELAEIVRAMLDQWLHDPADLARTLGLSHEKVSELTPDELVAYFLDRLKEQDGEHHGGSRWIGTRGTSPVGHSGYHPGGMRVGGISRNKSAVKVALDRRYKDYSQQGPITVSQMGEAFKRLKNMVPEGPKDKINIDKTVYETMKKAGEIEIVFDRSTRDRLTVILAIDNGGWSMDPYVDIVHTLFHYARAQFKDLKTFYFHNTVYEYLWEDPQRYLKPYPVDELVRLDPATRFFFVGDASMALYELTLTDGAINFGERSGRSGLERLSFIARTFPHAIWINPVAKEMWQYTHSIQLIRERIPMFELTLEGLEQAVNYSLSR